MIKDRRLSLMVETAAKAARSRINLDDMAKLLVSEESRKEFASLRRAFDEVNHDLKTKFSQLLNSARVPCIGLAPQMFVEMPLSMSSNGDALCFNL